MKLFEIFGTGRDRDIETNWKQQMADTAAQRTAAQAPVVRGFWLISREGKRLNGPFSTAEKAQQFKVGRPDRIPRDAVIRQM